MEARELTEADSTTIASWRYPDRYSTYDVVDAAVLAADHWAVADAGSLIGYCCFGPPARVTGAIEENGTLDVGYGLAPELVGRGHGHAFVAAILRFAAGRYDPQRFRLYVLDWNERSRRVAEGHGFAVESILDSDERPFLVMVRSAGGF